MASGPLHGLKGIQSAGQYSAVTGYGLVFGKNTNHSVTHQYDAPFEFTGKLNKVTIELKQAYSGPSKSDTDRGNSNEDVISILAIFFMVAALRAAAKDARTAAPELGALNGVEAKAFDFEVDAVIQGLSGGVI